MRDLAPILQDQALRCKQLTDTIGDEDFEVFVHVQVKGINIFGGYEGKDDGRFVTWEMMHQHGEDVVLGAHFDLMRALGIPIGG